MKSINLVFLSAVFASNATYTFADNISVTVKGMVCSFCAQGLKKTFGKKEEVKRIEVDLDNKLVKVETKDGASLSDEEITSTIHDAGFDVVQIERAKNA